MEPTTDTPKDVPASAPETPKVRSELAAFAVQNGVTNLAANFFEPYVNYRWQRWVSDHDPAHKPAGTYAQNLAGEFAGDIFGAGTLIAIDTLFPHQYRAFSRTARQCVEPIFDVIGNAALMGVREDSNFGQQLTDWKNFQERSFVRTMVAATGGMAGNLLVQKTVLGNPSSTGVILKGILMSTALTTALSLVARVAFPKESKHAEAWINERIVTPLLDNDPEDTPVTATSHANKILQNNDISKDSPPR